MGGLYVAIPCVEHADACSVTVMVIIIVSVTEMVSMLPLPQVVLWLPPMPPLPLSMVLED
jgi:hypothetical protein